MSEIDRIRWRCRRGTLEMDLLLTRFVEKEYPNLSDEEKQYFSELLDYPDTDLMNLLVGATSCLDQNIHAIIEKVRSLHGISIR